MPKPSVLLLIPPLTQLNTPYPSTAYLTGFLRAQGVEVRQGDLGLDFILDLFSKKGLQRVFNAIEAGQFQLDNELTNVLSNRLIYESTVDDVIQFLQHRSYTLAYRISAGGYLPEGPRFFQLEGQELFFGSISVQDRARYLCSLYLEDLGDLIQATVGPQFGFSRYAERIARTATDFAPIHRELTGSTYLLDEFLLEQLSTYFTNAIPQIVGFSVPFSGNLYGALKSAQWIKQHYPQCRIVLGGGYVNTELRDLTDPTVFDYVDFITLDDGEGPFMALLDHIVDPSNPLKRTFVRKEGRVVFENASKVSEFKHGDLPAPTYDGLLMDQYLSTFDVPNPMHRLWNDGRWNKLTIAHGCYWKKCSFCDISLDYIARYSPAPARNLVDKMEQLIAETGERGFHFVDEAAPPLAMRDLAIEILRRNLQVTWWTNIRFEKTFSPDLCQLLAASGCIAVTGGLEVASPRLLELMEKGITLEQVSRVCKGFRDAGILVHAYLMYGFPTQTNQETIDSLEVVRQLFKHRLIHSAYWHRFAMTAHSPVGLNPDKYGVIRTGPEFKGFAQNDLYHDDPTGGDHDQYGEGLRAALYNYMHDNGIDFPLQDFFDFEIPGKTVPSKFIRRCLQNEPSDWPFKSDTRLCWHQVRAVHGEPGILQMHTRKGRFEYAVPTSVGTFFSEQNLEITAQSPVNAGQAIQQLADSLGTDSQTVLNSEWWNSMRADGVIWLLKDG
ncbi:MAG: radical SAM protein [Flavobacteriales bacterium]|nr:radical SAM protein [Flavobacteriales bacterium]